VSLNSLFLPPLIGLSFSSLGFLREAPAEAFVTESRTF
jgi:hypothetical protein